MELHLHCHVCLHGMVPECRQIYVCFPYVCHGVCVLDLTSGFLEVRLLFL